jgi:vacuolar-type H+-ATPase subunit F/Vma7
MPRHVVNIQSQENSTTGTGFVIHTDAAGIYILTCKHVVDEIGIPFIEEVEAKVLTHSNFIDLAVLYIEKHYLQHLELKILSLQTKNCDKRNVIIIGFSKFNRNIDQKESIEATLYLNSIEFQSNKDSSFYTGRKLTVKEGYNFEHGHSGSPVICKETGNVIAVLSNKENDALGYAIDIVYLKEIWKEMPKELMEQKEVKEKPIPLKVPKQEKSIKSIRSKTSSASFIPYSFALLVVLFVASYFFFPETSINERASKIMTNQNAYLKVTYPLSVKKGEGIRIEALLRNNGKIKRRGGITLSFPEEKIINYSKDFNTFKTLTHFKIGEKIYNNQKNRSKKMSAIHPLIESEEVNWKEEEAHSFSIILHPNLSTKSFKILARGALTLESVVPKNGTKDQQAFDAYEIVVKIVN